MPADDEPKIEPFEKFFRSLNMKQIALVVTALMISTSALATATMPEQMDKMPSMSDTMPKKADMMTAQVMKGSYSAYTKEAFNKAGAMGQKRILFFHASWCPKCQMANKDFMKNAKNLPDNVVVFKANYDKEMVLRKKYSVVMQHTYVYVDNKGVAKQVWSGGGVKEVTMKVMDK